MHKYKRYQVDKGFSDLFGEQIRVIGDSDWVGQAIRESWFSISKSRGTWRVYLPYTLVFDVVGEEETERSSRQFYAHAKEILTTMSVKWRKVFEDTGYMDYFCCRFSSWHQAEQFAFMMQLHGCRYIPPKRVRHGPCANPE